MIRSLVPPCLALALVFTATLPLAAQSTDVVRLLGGANAGGTVRGTVTRMNKRNVTIDTSTTERRIEVNEIRFITFGNEPRDMREARTNMIEGRLNRAYEDLANIDESDISTEYVRQEINFMKASLAVGMALSGEGMSLADAETMLTDLLADEQFGENYNYYAAIRLQGDLALATGDYESAESNYSVLSMLPWPEVSLEGSLLVGESRLGLNKYNEALASFNEVESSELNDVESQESKLRAQIGKASALAGLDRGDEGIGILEQIIQQQSSENKSLFARIYNALGNCYLRAGNPKYAKHQFLHVDLLYYQDPESHAEALYHLVDLWAQENNQRNSNDARDRLQTSYPNSVWTSKL